MIPTVPVVVLSLVIATLYAALFHLLWGRGLKELTVGWIAALMGFGLGQLLASALSWHDVMIGELHWLAASATSWLAMAFVRQVKL